MVAASSVLIQVMILQRKFGIIIQTQERVEPYGFVTQLWQISKPIMVAVVAVTMTSATIHGETGSVVF